MIAPTLVAKIRRLLAEGTFSQREIARLTGISRGSVGRIATGKRPDCQRRRQPHDDEWEEPAGPAARCPGCGGMVYMPCLLCRVRKMKARKPQSGLHSMAIRIGQPLGLNLRPEHQARYEEVLAWRRKNGFPPIEE